MGITASSNRLFDCASGGGKQTPARSTTLTYRRGQQIYGEIDPPDHWYFLCSGAARNYALLADGRRRIVDFLLPGDYFGFRARYRSFAVEAIAQQTEVVRYSRRSLEAAADGDPWVAGQVREIAFEALARSQARLLILGRVTAVDKVGAFLLEMKARSSDADETTLTLPMSRYDIADYLAISVETVSRALSELRRLGVIRFAKKNRVLLLRRRLLEDGVDRDTKPVSLRFEKTCAA
jgi:CRP/FNR family transcriptional regulator, nitrogen fixation regulation protein